MRIAGLQKLSLVDYPGHLAAVVFLQGCNFRCGYCHNPGIITLDQDFGCDTEDVLSEIARLKDKIEGVVVTGGEPTMTPELIDLIDRIKKTDLLVKLDTNGSDPSMLAELYRLRLVDYIALDIKTSLGKYGLVTDVKGIADTVAESVMWLKLSYISSEFRTTCVPGIVKEEDILEIGELVRGGRKYCLQQFSPAVTLDPAFRDKKPYTRSELEHVRDILKPCVETVEIRGV